MSRRKRYYKRSSSYEFNLENIVIFVFLWLFFTIVPIIINFIKENYDLIKYICGISFGFIILVSISVFIIKRISKNVNNIERLGIRNIYNRLINRKYLNARKQIIQNSVLFSEINRLNNEYFFKDSIPFIDKYQLHRKSDLNNSNIDDYFLMTIDTKYNEISSYVSECESEIKKYNEYCFKYDNLKSYISLDEASKLNIKEDLYLDIQKTIYDEYKKRLINNYKIIVVITYNSAGGRVKDRLSKEYSLDNYYEFLNRYNELKTKKSLYEINSRIERAKMSESLRYDIMKRDNFKCQICGASSKEGAVLHVDHIIPVSKGGKTEPDNLQTLCSRCNIGKSNKMD